MRSSLQHIRREPVHWLLLPVFILLCSTRRPFLPRLPPIKRQHALFCAPTLTPRFVPIHTLSSSPGLQVSTKEYQPIPHSHFNPACTYSHLLLAALVFTSARGVPTCPTSQSHFYLAPCLFKPSPRCPRFQVSTEEYQFFLKGGSVLDRSSQPANPAPSWLSEEAWDNVTELDNLSTFKGVASSFEQSTGRESLLAWLNFFG